MFPSSSTPSRLSSTGIFVPAGMSWLGSTRYAAIPAAAEALTGRVDIIPVLPLTQGEIDGIRETFVARLLDGDGRRAGLPREAAAAVPGRVRPAVDGGRDAGGPAPSARAVAFPPGSPTTSTWFVATKDVMDIFAGPGSVRCCPGCWASSLPGQGRCINITHPVAGAIAATVDCRELAIKLLEAVFPERRGGSQSSMTSPGTGPRCRRRSSHGPNTRTRPPAYVTGRRPSCTGLLQTQDYARALISVQPHITPETVIARLAARMQRQERVLGRDNPPAAWFIIDELSLYRQVGSTTDMAAQLRHLLEVAAMPHATLQVLPAVATP